MIRLTLGLVVFISALVGCKSNLAVNFDKKAAKPEHSPTTDRPIGAVDLPAPATPVLQQTEKVQKDASAGEENPPSPVAPSTDSDVIAVPESFRLFAPQFDFISKTMSLSWSESAKATVYEIRLVISSCDEAPVFGPVESTGTSLSVAIIPNADYKVCINAIGAEGVMKSVDEEGTNISFRPRPGDLVAQFAGDLAASPMSATATGIGVAIASDGTFYTFIRSERSDGLTGWKLQKWSASGSEYETGFPVYGEGDPVLITVNSFGEAIISYTLEHVVTSNSRRDVVVRSYNPDGTQRWTNPYGSSRDDTPNVLYAAPDNSIFLSYSAFFDSAYIVKIDRNGSVDPDWNKQFDFDSTYPCAGDSISDIKVDGNVLFLSHRGHTRTSGSCTTGLFATSSTYLRKFNLDGTEVVSGWPANIGVTFISFKLTGNGSGGAYFADQGNTSIQQLDQNGSSVAGWPVTASAGVQFLQRVSGSLIAVTQGTTFKVEAWDGAGAPQSAPYPYTPGSKGSGNVKNVFIDTASGVGALIVNKNDNKPQVSLFDVNAKSAIFEKEFWSEKSAVDRFTDASFTATRGVVFLREHGDNNSYDFRQVDADGQLELINVSDMPVSIKDFKAKDDGGFVVFGGGTVANSWAVANISPDGTSTTSTQINNFASSSHDFTARVLQTLDGFLYSAIAWTLPSTFDYFARVITDDGQIVAGTEQSSVDPILVESVVSTSNFVITSSSNSADFTPDGTGLKFYDLGWNENLGLRQSTTGYLIGLEDDKTYILRNRYNAINAESANDLQVSRLLPDGSVDSSYEVLIDTRWNHTILLPGVGYFFFQLDTSTKELETAAHDFSGTLLPAFSRRYAINGENDGKIFSITDASTRTIYVYGSSSTVTEPYLPAVIDPFYLAIKY